MKSTTQIPTNISLLKMPQLPTKSALERNLKAKASSKKPSTTLTVVIHPPDFGKEFNQAGNIANSANGKAKAKPKPTIPEVKLVATLPSARVVLPNKPPNMGPVQENDTIAKVNAIKKIPSPPPTLDEAESILLAQELGNVSS